MNGFEFTAGDGTVTEATLTAVFVGTDVMAETSIVLGRGSEVLWNFEEGEQANVKRARAMGATGNYLDYKKLTKFSIVTAEDGMVHSGNNALKMEIDFSASTEMGFINAGLNFDLPDLKDGKGGKKLTLQARPVSECGYISPMKRIRLKVRFLTTVSAYGSLLPRVRWGLSTCLRRNVPCSKQK